MKRYRLLAATSISAVLLTALPIAATADGASSHARTVHLVATATSPPPTIGTPACDPSGRCLAATGLTSTYSGDLTGTSTVNGSLYVNPATFEYQATSLELFSGQITGCGSGTFVMHYPLLSGTPAPYVAKGEIVAGSGTGDLVGISGSADSEFTQSATGATSRLVLRLRCKRV